MKPLPHIITAVILICGGIFAGREVFSSSYGRDLATTVERISPRSLRATVPLVIGGEKPEGKRDLASLYAYGRKVVANGGELESTLERMSARALKDLAREQFRALVELEIGGEIAAANRNLHAAAIDILWRQLGTEALDWASELEDSLERGMMMETLLEIALSKDVSSAIAWMESNDGKAAMWRTKGQLMSTAMRSAASANADDVILAYSLFKGTNLSNPLFQVEYAEDFDFVKLHDALGDKTDLSDTYARWASRDREGAWAFLKDHLSSPAPHRDSGFKALLTTAVEQDGEREGVKWVLDRLATLSPEAISSQILESVSRANLSAEGYSMIGASLEAGERPDFAVALVRSIGVNPRTHGVLDMLSREELMTLVTANLPSQNLHRFVAVAHLKPDRIISDLMERYQLTPEEMSWVQEKSPSVK